MGLFSRGIDIKTVALDAEGFFRSGRRPTTGQPLAEIYSLADPADEPRLWWLEQQEELSRAPGWGEDYFRHWAEILALGAAAGDIGVMPAWMIVVFDASGAPMACVEYRPIMAGGRIDDVGYDSAAQRLVRWPEAD